MSIALNHTIVHARDTKASAELLAEILGVGPTTTYGPFVVVQVGDVALDFDHDPGEIQPQHYAFLVSDDEFDAIVQRLDARGITYFADPGKSQPDEHNTDDGGRGLYWEHTDGHLMEMITRPYGSG